MTVIPVHAIDTSELSMLGNNTLAAVEVEQEEIAAINRSLAGHGEVIDAVDLSPAYPYPTPLMSH